MLSNTALLVCAGVAVAGLIFLIVRLKVSAFVALILASLFVGIAAGMEPLWTSSVCAAPASPRDLSSLARQCGRCRQTGPGTSSIRGPESRQVARTAAAWTVGAAPPAKAASAKAPTKAKELEMRASAVIFRRIHKSVRPDDLHYFFCCFGKLFGVFVRGKISI